MMRARVTERKNPVRKTGYHHGDLSNQLVEAARQLVEEHGSERCTLAAACRIAGVSTAAPYRHFADKQELLHAVAERGFLGLSSQTRDYSKDFTEGSAEAIAAIGRAYVDFAVAQPGVFRLMFSATEEDSVPDSLRNTAMAAYGVLLHQVAAHFALDEEAIKVREKALYLWTFVHGLSFLLIDGKLGITDMSVDIAAMIRSCTEKLLTD